MRALFAMSLLFVAKALAGEHHFASPNGELRLHDRGQRGRNGMKALSASRELDRRRRASQTEQSLHPLLKWSPNTLRFLAVMDHLDGHISDVYIFAVAAVDAGPTLFYHTPGLHRYDVQWEVTG